MSSTSSRVTIGPVGGVRGIGMIAVLVGIVMVVAGVGAGVLVPSTFAGERIMVADDAPVLAGQEVSTSAVALAVCPLVVVLGLLFVLVGGALRRLAGGPQVAVETPGLSSQGGLSESGRHAEEQPTTPLPPSPPGPPPTRSSSRPAHGEPSPSQAPATTGPAAPPPPAADTPRPPDQGGGPRA